MSGADDWERMDARPRRPFGELVRGELPTSAGVYALYRDGQRQYVGKAKDLRQRVWSNHGGRGTSLTGSAMRRNVAAHLGIASAADMKARR